MEVNDEMIVKLAELAKLEFSDAEKEEIRSDLQRMIAFVDKLKELDTSCVEPLTHMGDSENVFREDVLKPSITREEGLKNAPDTDGIYFRVPKVIKK